eukprot:m.44626 g.44626  ORF g.44626 m.44626 type:complete len:446 (+) comp19722_c1_seq1:176-1513(+)
MSDDDFMQDSEEEYDFEYESDDDASNEDDVGLENTYYNAKQNKDDEPDEAFSGFAKVIELEEPKGEWGFKALKQTMKLSFRRGEFEKVIDTYKTLLTYIESVPRNYSEKSINNMMDLISSSKKAHLLQEFFDLTMAALMHDRKDLQNDRLWFKANVKLGKMYLDEENFVKLSKVIRQLEQSCLGSEGEDDERKGTQIFEVLALKVPMLTAQKNTKELKKEYNRALKIKSAIPHPLIMGIIRECGGKMYLSEQQWDLAYSAFFEAFKNYDESGSVDRIKCLKMMVLSNMLMKSTVDPFDAQEMKPYKNTPQIKAMTDLVMAYQAYDIKQFEKVLKLNKKDLLDDPFIREHITDLLNNIRTEVLIKLIKPYTRIKIAFISKALGIAADEVELLLRMCILDGTVSARIDQVEQLLILDFDAEDVRYHAIDKWSSHLTVLLSAIESKLT